MQSNFKSMFLSFFFFSLKSVTFLKLLLKSLNENVRPRVQACIVSQGKQVFACAPVDAHVNTRVWFGWLDLRHVWKRLDLLSVLISSPMVPKHPSQGNCSIWFSHALRKDLLFCSRPYPPDLSPKTSSLPTKPKEPRGNFNQKPWNYWFL